MTFFSFIPLSVFCINIYLFAYIYAKPNRRAIHKAFLLYIAITSGWPLGDFLSALQMPEIMKLPFIKVRSLFWLPVGFLYLNFIYSFLHRKKDLIHHAFHYGVIISICINLSTEWIVKTYRPTVFGIDDEPGFLFTPITFLIIALPILLTGYHTLKHYRKETNPVRRIQVLLLLWGAGAPLIVGYFTDVILPNMLGLTGLMQVASSTLVFQSVLIFISITKYDFLNLQLEDIAGELFAHTKDGIMIVNPQGQILQFNNAAERLLAIKNSSRDVQNITSIIPEYSFNTTFDNHELTINDCTLAISQSAIQSKKSEQNKIVIIHDLTAIKKAQQALEKSEEHYRALFENTGAATVIIEEDKTLSFVNSAFEKLSGYPRQEIEGKMKWTKMVHPEDLKFMVVQHRNRRLDNRKASNKYEFRVVNRYGEIKNVMLNVDIMAGTKKSVASLTDITSLKEAREKIARAKQDLDQIFNAAVPLAVTDKTLTIIRANDNYLKLFEKTNDQVIGKRCYEIHNTDLCHTKSCIFERILRGDRDTSMEINQTTLSGKKIWCLLSATPYENSKGEIIGMIENLTDIMPLKATEADLKKAKYEAEAANKAKSQFLANMSHEIRTPMNAVIGLTDIVLDTSLTEDQQQYLQMVKNSSTQLLGILNDILDFSKIESGQLELESINFDLLSVVESVADIIIHQVQEIGLELHILVQPDVPIRLIGDPGRLRQILINLAGNAIKFTSQGAIELTVALYNMQDDEALVHFTVKDTGIGIAEDRLNTIFDSFTQADTSTARKFGGTGLGLAISKQLVQLMSGIIWVESTLHEGSKFHFTAKFKIQPEVDVHVPVHRENRQALVIENNHKIQSILETMLGSQSYSAIFTDHAEEAISYLSGAQQFQLIIVDLDMSTSDTEKMNNYLRSNTKKIACPIVALTPFGISNQNFLDFPGITMRSLVKPIKPSKFYATLQSFDETSDTATDPTRQQDFSFDARAAIQAILETRKINILVVEDNIINQRVLSSILAKVNLDVEIANDGQEAVDAIESGNYDLVLMDIQMPKMDGLTATQYVRQTIQKLDLPIIALTAHAMKGDKDKCLAVGMNDYLSKPIDPNELFRIILKWLVQEKIPAK